MTPSELLRAMMAAAIAAADPARVLPPALARLGEVRGRLIVIGAGKAAGAMARAVEANWHGQLEGIVVTRYGYGAQCSRIEVVEAAHPVPDAAGEAAAQRIFERVQGLSADDVVLALISGGGSALLAAPRPGLAFADKRAITRALLASGAAIGEMNCLRKHLSLIKGGQLAAAAAPARIVTLAISDVPGDDPAVIASGPTVADPTTCADALAIVDRYRIDLPAGVRAQLAAGAWETPKPGDPRLGRSEYLLVGSARAGLLAAADLARVNGVAPLILGDEIEGEAREAARVMAGIARACVRSGQPLAPPCVILSGGETTVTLGAGAAGRGGRNSEFLLALAIALQGHPAIDALAVDTDGIDGSEDNAGAICAPQTLARAAALGLSAPAMLDRHDAYGFFEALGDLLVTGPTLTNINDFRAILVADPETEHGQFC